MATVAVEHTTLGTYSDEQGHYAIRLKEGTYTLVVSSVGFESVRWKVSHHDDKQHHFLLK